MLKKIVLIFLLLVLQACAPPQGPTTTGQAADHTPKPRGTTIRPTKNEGRNEDGRYALVIGNASYKTSPLRNPVNDARDIARSLRRLGFVVIEKENSSRKEMTNSIREFGELIAKGGVGLFYYAGHGMQVKGKNYLIPVNANLKHEDEVAYESVDVDRLLAKMDSAGNRLNIVILDACRNNPFARSFRSGSRGLARMNAPVGTLIAYATSPNSLPCDGKRGECNGLYTKYLLANMEIPGLEIRQMFRRVRQAVLIATNQAQLPWESSSMEGDFYFVAQTTVVNQPPAPFIKQKPQPPVVNISDSKSLIILPTDGASVSHMVQVSGTYSKYNANKDFWLVVQPVQYPQYHPHTSKILKQRNKNWKSIAYVGQSPKHNIGDEFIIYLVSATESASRSFIRYLQESAKNKRWVGLDDLPSGTSVLHSISVVRK